MRIEGAIRVVAVHALAALLLGSDSASAQSEASEGDWLEHATLFAGPDGSKQPQDLGINANMGIRLATNVGLALLPSQRVGLQFGVGVNVSDAAVQVLEAIEGTSRRTQTFVTIGLFQRPTDRLTWGVAYDVLSERYYDTFLLAQLRGQGSYRVGASDELGAWFTVPLDDDSGLMGGTPVSLEPITQINAFTRHTWANMAQTAVWLGFARQHSRVVWVFPGNFRDTNVLVYGAELSMPLSDLFAITGAANFITPTATGTVDAFLGVSFFPKRSALRRPRSRFAPVHDVANNPSMAVDLRR